MIRPLVCRLVGPNAPGALMTCYPPNAALVTASPRRWGYGQGFMTQSALLLDRMDDATQMTEWIARLCFAPRQPHPYRVPECAMMKSDGSMWARRGDLGNGFQAGEVLIACQILLGIDDYDANTLEPTPRLPIGWTWVRVHKWPVRVSSLSRSEMVMLSMELTRDKGCNKCDFKVSVDKPVDNVAIRVGPFPIFNHATYRQE